MNYRQLARAVLMVRPARFGYNPETASTNAFQREDASMSTSEIRNRALAEFDAFVERLRAHDIQVVVAEDNLQPVKTDAVFPNNWVSFHEDGTIITYPMHAPTRRAERREEVIREVLKDFECQRRMNFSMYESENRFLEGTGSMVFDRANRLVYACVGPRTDDGLLEKFCQWVQFDKINFRAVDQTGLDIYHTNVLLTIGQDFAVICMEAVPDPADRAKLLDSFAKTNKEVIEISLEQMTQYAGNLLQVENKQGISYLVMSEQAFRAFTPEQVERLEQYTHLLHSPLYTIEMYGGGSARCMLAEIFLPRKGA